MSSTIYVELLLNLRQLTIFVSLTSRCNDNTKIELSADRETLSVHHDAQDCDAKLPVKLPGSTQLKLPSQSSKEFSIRLSVGQEIAIRSIPGQPRLLPCSAATLSRSTEIKCKFCGSGLNHAGRVKIWKDLPNENWAEMMDLWHCHKPDNPDGPNGDASFPTKGYSANNKLMAQSGVGFVNVGSILLSPEDCCGIQVCPLSYSDFMLWVLQNALVLVSFTSYVLDRASRRRS